MPLASMTRDELYVELLIILTDESLTHEQRTDKMLPVAVRLFNDADLAHMTAQEKFELWDDIVVEIVEKHNLRRQ
jgi:hypothetical protein